MGLPPCCRRGCHQPVTPLWTSHPAPQNGAGSDTPPPEQTPPRLGICSPKRSRLRYATSRTNPAVTRQLLPYAEQDASVAGRAPVGATHSKPALASAVRSRSEGLDDVL